MAAYKIIDVEGIGPVYAEKLLAAGITDTDILLEKCGKPAGRKALAEETGISPKLILTWTNHADLIRINGIGPQFAELLEAAGVDTVKELKHRKPENLQPKLVEINEEKNLVGRVPALKEVERMIAEAAEHRRAAFAIVLLHEVEVRSALEVDQVAGVDDVVVVELGPCDGIAKRLLLPTAERAYAPLGNLPFPFALVGIRRGEVRVGDVQDRERL